jgi:hypothetical protein
MQDTFKDGVRYSKSVTTWKVPETTPDERYLIVESSKPAAQSLIIDMLSRYLGSRKTHYVNEKVLPQFYTDYASYLRDYPEYAIALGMNDVIKNGERYFPQEGVLIDAIEKHWVKYPSGYSEDLKDGDIAESIE